MRILLTNDDGIEAPGLKALQRLCSRVGEAVVVAPSHERSGASHSTTMQRPIAVTELGRDRVAVDGTPADCVRLGLSTLFPDCAWVIAGINRGGNLGVDVHLSGTVAAAREAFLLGRPSLAISQYVVRDRPLDWDLSGDRAEAVLLHVLERSPNGGFWNANLPHPEHERAGLELVECELDPSPLEIRYRQSDAGFLYVGNYHARPRRPGHDIDVCFGGRISLTHVPV